MFDRRQFNWRKRNMKCETSRIKEQGVKEKFDTINKWTFDRSWSSPASKGKEDDTATSSPSCCAIVKDRILISQHLMVRSINSRRLIPNLWKDLTCCKKSQGSSSLWTSASRKRPSGGNGSRGECRIFLAIIS